MGNKGASEQFTRTVALGAVEYSLFWIHCMILIINMHGIYFHFNPQQRSQNADQ